MQARSLLHSGRSIILCIGLGACGVVRVAPAPAPANTTGDSVAPPRGQRFYTGKTYGTEAQFNPLSLVVNGGFDQLRNANADRRIFEMNYSKRIDGVWKAVSRPDRVLETYTFERFVKRQLLPLSGKGSGGGQWLPNYQMHLFGGGMTGVRMTEWYQQHDVGHPELAAAGTVAAWHVLTEMVEHHGIPTADAVADLLIFDPAAFLVWRNDWVQRTFSTRFQMTNWSGQPAIATPRATIQNMHQTTMLRYKLTENYRPLTTFGGSFLTGVSRRVGAADWVSFAAGWDPTENPIIDPVTGERTVTLNANVALFYDRDASLLGALHLRFNRKELITLNVYPGVVHFGKWAPGMFMHVLSDGRMRFGIVPRLGVGLGVE